MFHPHSICKSLGAIVLCCALATAHADEWLPITPDELKMSSEPNAPAAAAIYLYRQVDRDDNEHFQTVYSRIKILTEEGRNYGDVEILYDRNRSEQIQGITARTIRPDGSIVKFDGTIFEKPIIKGRGRKLLAKTFTLPGVEVGSIIEYRYRHVLREGYVYDSHWILSQELFTKYAKFSLTPHRDFNMNFSWPKGLPPGTEAPKIERGIVRLETRNVAAFVTEDHMPPEDELKFHVDFLYSMTVGLEKDPAAYWKKFGKESYKKI